MDDLAVGVISSLATGFVTSFGTHAVTSRGLRKKLAAADEECNRRIELSEILFAIRRIIRRATDLQLLSQSAWKDQAQSQSELRARLRKSVARLMNRVPEATESYSEIRAAATALDAALESSVHPRLTMKYKEWLAEVRAASADLEQSWRRFLLAKGS